MTIMRKYVVGLSSYQDDRCHVKAQHVLNLSQGLAEYNLTRSSHCIGVEFDAKVVVDVAGGHMIDVLSNLSIKVLGAHMTTSGAEALNKSFLKRSCAAVLRQAMDEKP